MNRTAVLVLAIAMIMSACSPLPFLGGPTVTPVVDSQATDAALAGTLAAETLNALPSPTLVPATDTPVLAATSTGLPTATGFVTESLTSAPAAAITGTTPATFTMTVSPIPPVNATATETLHPRFFGTLPPAIPFGQVNLVNKAKAEVYVSLQCKTIDGYTTIIEYPVFGRLRVSAPAGKYNYVAWVGGRQFKGSFSLSKGEELSLTFNKDKVTIK